MTTASAKTLIAYHGKSAEKTRLVKQLTAHYKADEIIHGVYWEDGKGCAVGCTIHSNDHAQYESLLGIPQALARLEDTIFEGMKNGDSKEWPLRFAKAITPGADLSRVQWQFLHWLLSDEKVNPGINHPLVKDAVAQCREVMANAMDGHIDESAESAARSAWSAAWSAAESAESAESAARSAARSAAESAAWSAARSARSAESAAFKMMADKLESLLKAAK